MNIRNGMRSHKLLFSPVAILLTVLFAAGIVFAAVFGTGTGERAPGSGGTVVVNAHNVCKKVTNNNGLDMFIPTNVAPEWQNFRDNAPNKALAECSFWDLKAGSSIPCDRVWAPGYPVSTVNGVSAPSCYSNGYPQGVYGYAAVDFAGLPWIRLQGYCSYFTSYLTFDTGWVQTTALNGQGYCPVGFGWLVNATSVLSSSGFEVHSWYGGGYHGSFFMDWNGNVSYPPDPTYCDTSDPNGACYSPPLDYGGD